MQGYENGFYLGGNLFDHVTKDMRIYKEEIFGPVLSVAAREKYDEALGLCNDHEYGNGVAIFTRDGDAARDFAAKVHVGMVGVNVPIPVPVAYYTFGGWKRSGFGDLNQHGPDAFRFYTKTKTVTSRWPSGVKEGASSRYRRRAELLQSPAPCRPRAGFFLFVRWFRLRGMSDAAAMLMTVDEFLVWGEGREGRWELHDGVIVAMSPERVVHLEAKGNVLSCAFRCDPHGQSCLAGFIRMARQFGISRRRLSSPMRWSAAVRPCPPTRLKFPTRSSSSKCFRRALRLMTEAPKSRAIFRWRA